MAKESGPNPLEQRLKQRPHKEKQAGASHTSAFYLVLLGLHAAPVQEPLLDRAGALADRRVGEFKEGLAARGRLRSTADQAGVQSISV